MVSFTSHGAMVDVSLPGGGVLHCYIPLTAMGTPPPTRARQVLKKGEARAFVLAGLDPPRRVAELALPALPARTKKRGATERQLRREEGDDHEGCAAAPKKAAAKKVAPAKKATRKTTAPAKKAAAKKATKTKKAPAAKKAAAAKKSAKARAR